MEAKHVNEFRPYDVLWEKISKGLLRNPDRPLKDTDKRMVYIYNNMFFVKKDFTFGFRTVMSGEIHLIQTTNVPMLIYEFPSSSLRCRANPNLFRRSFEAYDQMLYHRMVLEPLTAYPIPAGTRYILLTVQKTVFGLNTIPEMILAQIMENGFNLGDFRKNEMVRSKDLQATASYPDSCTFRDKQTTFGRTARVFLQTASSSQIFLPDPPVQIPVFQPPVQIPDPPVPTTPLVQIPVFQPPVQIPPVPTTPPVQLFLPDPPPVQILLPSVVETGANPYGRLFNRSDHVVRIWRLLATRASPGSYPRTPVA
ncbi:hypothetical protein TNCV_1728841 [Trichonephila clavipes]|nr:hypothetical protein TNCV_1728841 [Trichonephila clavipes]